MIGWECVFVASMSCNYGFLGSTVHFLRNVNYSNFQVVGFLYMILSSIFLGKHYS